MTRNQIDWLNNQETERHNRRSERQAEIAHQQTLAEAQRHNIATEREEQRSNLASEDLRRQANAINKWNLDETVRSHQATEAETNRANVARETETHSYNTGYLADLANYHLGSLTETNRANIARENETIRSNLAQERINTFLANVKQQEADTNEYNADIANRRQNTYELSTLLSRDVGASQAALNAANAALSQLKGELTEQQTKSESFKRILDTINTGVNAADTYFRGLQTSMKLGSLIGGAK